MARRGGSKPREILRENVGIQFLFLRHYAEFRSGSRRFGKQALAAVGRAQAEPDVADLVVVHRRIVDRDRQGEHVGR